MTVELGERFQPGFSGRPPGMSPEDLAIWQRFRVGLTKVNALYFNVRLGQGRPGDGTADPGLLRMWRQVTARRADVVLDTGNEWVIVELRDRAQANAIGRLQLYLQLWRAAPPDQRPVSGWLVTNTRESDLEQLAESVGIQYTVV